MTTDMIVREFQAVDVGVEGRTVDVRVVPFDEVAEVADPPYERSYLEQWMPGCFDHQLRAASRIHANVNHSQHVIDTVGHGLSLRSERDGYHASFEIHETQAGETALALLRGGALPSVSLEAQAHPKGSRNVNGIVQRFKAHLRAVSFVREGAFAGAQVLAVREAQIIDKELLPIDIPPERVERLRAQGIQLPSRYQAHPAEDTPVESGTPETAPASDEPTTSEE